MDREILDKIARLNTLHKEIQKYKQEHPEEKVGHYPNSYGRILNAYREGDLTFDECVELLPKVPETGQLRAAAEAVEEWWLRDGKHSFNGCPAAIFNLRSALDTPTHLETEKK